MVAQSFIKEEPAPRHRGSEAHSEAVEAARGRLPGSTELERLGDFFKVIGDPTRLAILHSIGQGELCVSDLSAALALSESAVSHQLALLRRTRLVTSRRDGRTVYYRLADHHAWQIIDSGRVHLLERE